MQHIRTSIAYLQVNGKIKEIREQPVKNVYPRYPFLNLEDAKKQIVE
ncbi:MAG: hypothetical protein IPJ45_02460 [Ignavibacteria bacterium]|nr:hypothetical protein [Ignavibacteria bacterium]